MQLTMQGKLVPEEMTLKGLAQGPSGEATLLATGFKPTTFRVWVQSLNVLSHTPLYKKRWVKNSCLHLMGKKTHAFILF